MLHTGCMSNGGVSAFGAREQQEARLPQGVVRYRELGAGQPIVLVHGLLTNSLLWAEVAELLAEEFRVIAPDWPLGSHPIALAPGTDFRPPALRPRAPRRLPFAFGWLSKRPLPADVSDAFMHPVLSDAGVRRDVRALLRGIDKRYTLEAAERFKDFHKPVLIAWAPDDRFFKFYYAERVASAFPHARPERIEDSYTFVS